MDIIYQIKECIEKQLDKGNKKFIIFPFGSVGVQIKNTLKDLYDIDASYILDNHLYKYNSNIKQLSFLKEINSNEYTVILASINTEIYLELKESLMKYIDEENIAELSSLEFFYEKKNPTKVGKYSAGSLCNHWLVESIGAFSSFAIGCDVLQNHPTKYLSTHPFLYYGSELILFMIDLTKVIKMKSGILKECLQKEVLKR